MIVSCSFVRSESSYLVFYSVFCLIALEMTKKKMSSCEKLVENVEWSLSFKKNVGHFKDVSSPRAVRVTHCDYGSPFLKNGRFC